MICCTLFVLSMHMRGGQLLHIAALINKVLVAAQVTYMNNTYKKKYSCFSTCACLHDICKKTEQHTTLVFFCSFHTENWPNSPYLKALCIFTYCVMIWDPSLPPGNALVTSTDASHIVYNYSALLQLRSGFPKNLLFYIVQMVIIYKKKICISDQM